MSLWWNRRRIEAAVLGELDAAGERRLFAHLRRCAACRGHYDTLSSGMNALSTLTRDARETARVLARTPVAERPTGRERWVYAGLAVATVALLTLALPTTRSEEVTLRGGDDTRGEDITLRGSGGTPGEDVTLRGGNTPSARPTTLDEGVALRDGNTPSARPSLGGGALDGGDETPAPFSLLAYARRGDGPVRLAADLPLATGGSVARDERVQFFVRHPWPAAQVTVVGLGPDGTRRTLAEGPVGAAAQRSSAVGAPIDLSTLPPGAWTLEATLREGDGGTLLVRGVLELKP